jgi:hypothetical protein
MKEGIESLGDYENYTEFFTSIKDALYTKFYEYINSKHFPELSVAPRHARLPFPGAINYTGEIPMSRMFSGQ